MNRFRTSTFSALGLLCALTITSLALSAGCGDTTEQTPVDHDILSITSPDEDSFENSRTVTVEGTIDGEYDVEVNGVEAEVDGQNWTAEVVFGSDGPVTATATAGDAEQSVDFVIDTFIPEIEIHSPERGTAIDSDEDYGTVTITGEIGAVGHSGLEYVEIAGRSVDVADDNTFEHDMTVRPGFNLIEATVTDRARNEGVTNRALVFGPLTDPDSPVDEAAHIDITNPEGIDTLTGVAEAFLTPERVMEFIEAGFADEDIPVEITSVDWDELNFDLNPTDGVLEISIRVEQLEVEGEFPFDEDSDPVEGDISAEYLQVDMDAAIEINDDGELELDVIDDSIDAGDITITVDGEERGWLETPAKIALGVGFEMLIETLVEETLFDPEMLEQEVEVMDRTLEITILLQDILITPSGIRIELGFQFPGSPHELVADIPGALNRPVAGSPGASVPKPLLVHTDRTSMDRLLHGVWESGLLHQSLGREDVSDLPLPFELTADGLGSLLDSRIADIHEPDTPAEFQLRPLLPPVVDFDDDAILAQIGDMLVDIYLLPEGKDTETLVLTMALHLDIDVELEFDDHEVGFDLDIGVTGDIADEPEFSFDRRDTVDLLIDIIELVPGLVSDELAVDTEEAIEWATVTGVETKTHGADGDDDRITVGASVEPAEDYIEDDDADDDDDDDD